jgi:DNA invertase Pin-like site-specific DNA recombinase
MNGQTACYLRVSDTPQDEERQRKALRAYVSKNNVDVPPALWETDKEARDRSGRRPGFQRLLALAKKGEIGCILIERQDRFGTADADEWGYFRYLLRQAGCSLIEVTTGRDLTAPDIATRIISGLAAETSEREQLEKGIRSLGGRVSKARDKKCWNGGAAPYGFDKACLDSQGNPLWFLHYLSRSHGEMIVPCQRCRGTPRGLTDNAPCQDCRRMPVSVKCGTMPRKKGAAGENVILIPSEDQSRVDLARQCFQLYTTRGEHTAGIAALLREAGFSMYGHPVTHVAVQRMLENPCYRGNYAFGRIARGRFAKWDGDGVKELPAEERPPQGALPKARPRPRSQWVVHDGLWQGLIDPATWEAAQKKLASRKGSRHPRIAAQCWLKGILYCGTCRRPMMARPKAGRNGYCCVTYHQKATYGNPHGCHYHRISQAAAVQLVEDRLAEMKLTLGDGGSREAILKLYALCGRKLDDVARFIRDGVLESLAVLRRRFAEPGDDKLGGMISEFLELFGGAPEATPAWLLDFLMLDAVTLVPTDDVNVGEARIDAGAVRERMEAIEQEAAACAARRLAAVNEKLRVVVLAKAQAASPRERAILDGERAALEAEADRLEQQAVPMSERLRQLTEEVRGLVGRIDAAEKALAEGENMLKAEAVRQALGRVYLHFDAERKGRRWHCRLRPDLTEFESAAGGRAC